MQAIKPHVHVSRETCIKCCMLQGVVRILRENPWQPQGLRDPARGQVCPQRPCSHDDETDYAA
jgi:hypothetical protein